jgi:hypothetical protein
MKKLEQWDTYSFSRVLIMNVAFNNNSVSKKKLETLTIIGCFSADINKLSLRVGF